MARKIIAGNWKMNHDLNSGLDMIKTVNQHLQNKPLERVDAVIATPYIHLAQASQIVKAKRLSLASQDCSANSNGAFTGEVSAAQLKSVGTELIIIGHSERRQYFHESDALLSAKIKQAWNNGMLPIFCVGESLEQRQSGAHFSTVEKQIKGALGGFSADALENMIIAYEPVWAIGTGETASPEQAQEMHNHIRNFLAQMHNATLADEVSLLYGGSVKPSNAKELFSQPDVDGGLIGGAALEAASFIELLEIGEAVLR